MLLLISWLTRHSLRSILLCRKGFGLLYLVPFISLKDFSAVLDSPFCTVDPNDIAVVILRFALHPSKIIVDFIKDLGIQVLFLLLI